MPGEPAPHWYLHRPLAALLGPCFAAGLVVDGLEEPAFTPEQAGPDRLLSWLNYTNLPPVLVVRARPVSPATIPRYRFATAEEPGMPAMR